MKSLILVITITSFLSPSTYARSTEACKNLLCAASDSLAIGRTLSAALSEEDLGRHLRKLTGIEPIEDVCIGDRCSHENKVRARKYIVSRLLAAGFTEDEIEFETKGASTKIVLEEETEKKKKKKDREKLVDIPPIERDVVNIVARVKGSLLPSEVLEVSAHYDTAGDRVPGADDNGSGVVTTLEIAERIVKLKPERTVRFVFADLEERGFIGTQMHVDAIRYKNETFLGAIVIDMIGFFPKWSEERPRFVVEIGERRHHSSERGYESSIRLGNTLIDQGRAFTRSTDVQMGLETALPGTGDHGPYWRAGLPAIFVATVYEGKYINPGYHNSGDIMDGMNWPFFHSVAQQVAETVVRISGAAPVGNLAAEHYPSQEYLASNRDYVAVEVARVAQERAKKEAEARRLREENEKRIAQEKLEREQREAGERLARKELEQNEGLPKNLKFWHFDQLVTRVKAHLKSKYKEDESGPIAKFLTQLFFGESDSITLSDASFLNFGTEILREAAPQANLYNMQDFEEGGSLAKFRDRLRKQSVEILYNPNPGYGNASTLIRFGELVFASVGSRLEVSVYNPSAYKGYKGAVFVTTAQGIDRLLLRFAHYCEFVRGHRGLGMSWEPMTWRGEYDGGALRVYSAGFTYEFHLVDIQSSYFALESDAHFRIPITAEPPRNKLPMVRISTPTAEQFGVSVLRDVLGLAVPADAKDGAFFEKYFNAESEIPFSQMRLDYGSKHVRAYTPPDEIVWW